VISHRVAVLAPADVTERRDLAALIQAISKALLV
jgi:hypothetical protein